MRRLALVPLLLALSSCSMCITTEDETINAARASGLAAVDAGTWAPFRCGEDDRSGRSFSARNNLGVDVNGTVCCGWFKGCTVRY